MFVEYGSWDGARIWSVCASKISDIDRRASLQFVFQTTLSTGCLSVCFRPWGRIVGCLIAPLTYREAPLEKFSENCALVYKMYQQLFLRFYLDKIVLL